MIYRRVFFRAVCLLASSVAFAADAPPSWITDGPYVEQDAIAFELPVNVLGNQILIEVEVRGTSRRFLFDTGSPSMMSADLAAELGLEAVDKRRSRDSHGTVVETEIMQSDITVGGTTFRKVPLFVTGFPKTAQCLFDGVLGSEVLPLCAWQIDLPDGVLRCNTDPASLEHLANANRVQLYDFGYPHSPILDIQFAKKARSKALIDTGSPEYLTISPPDFEGAKRNGGIGRTISGTGSIGGSIGGRAPERDQLMAQLKTLSIGPDKVQLGRVGALLRESPPTLIGASILQHFIVTLDAKNSSAYFDQYRSGPFARSSHGFGLAFDDAVPSVSMVWSDSPAAAAGMRPGQRVQTINGQPVNTTCAGIRRALQAMSEGETIEIEWEGGSATLVRESTILD